MKKIAIIGAGISGLTTAYLLKKKGHKVSVFEKSHRVGGYIGTQYKDKYIVEIGANGFLNNEPKTLELVKMLNLESEMINSQEDAKIRYLMFDGKMRAAPNKPQEILKSDLLSWSAKFKIFKEMLFPPKPIENVDQASIFDFVKNHFGEEIAENIVRSALIGIYAGDAKKLSVEKTLKKLIILEKEHGSLIKGMKASFKKNGKSNLVSFKRGMQTLIERLQQELRSDILLSHEVLKIYREDSKINIQIRTEDEETNFDKFDDVIITLPATEIPQVALDFMTPELFAGFKKYPVAPVRTLSLAFKEKINFKGFGTLISPKENMNILGFLHPKDIFPGRCPEDKDLFTIMMGGSFKPEIMKLSTQASIDVAIKDLEKIFGKLPQLEAFWIWNHTPGISQYNTDQILFMNQIEKHFENENNVHLNSQMIGGVAINDCIRKSFEVSDKF